MLAKCYVVLFLSIVFALSNASSDAKHEENQIVNETTFNITLRSVMPNNGNWVAFTCGNVGNFILPLRNYYSKLVPIDKPVTCNAYWGNLKATVTLFDAQKDLVSAHQVVYWQIQYDGFYHSLGNLFGYKRASWE